MHSLLNFVLLEEWNDSVLVIMFLIFLIPVIPVYFILYKLTRSIHRFKPVIDDWKSRNSFRYLLFVAGIAVVSILVTFGLLWFFFYENS